MGKVVNRQVINGRMVVTQTRRNKRDGLHVESLVYAGPEAVGEPVSEQVMSYELRYDMDYVATVAERQTPREPKAPIADLVARQRQEVSDAQS